MRVKWKEKELVNLGYQRLEKLGGGGGRGGDLASAGQFENGKNTRKCNLQKALLIKSTRRRLQ